MLCPKCQAQNPEGSKNCISCGASLISFPKQNQIPPKKNIKKFVLVFLLGILLILSAAFLFFKSPWALNTVTWNNYEQAVANKQIKPAGQILEVKIHFDSESDPSISIQEIAVKNGYVPKYEEKDEYKLQLNNGSTTVYSLGFAVPRYIFGAPPRKGQTNESAEPLFLKTVDFILNAPWLEEATEVTIVDSEGKAIDVKSLADVSQVDNKPDFYFIEGNEISKIDSGVAQAEGLSEETREFLDILFVGNDYQGDFDKFHRDVLNFSNRLLTFEPFRSRASQIRFYYVDNSTDLECKYKNFGLEYSSRGDRFLICDIVKAAQVANDFGVQYDRLYIIENNDEAGGSAAGEIAWGFNGGNLLHNILQSSGEFTFVHEFGHSFGELYDEYISRSGVSGENEVPDAKKNCYKGQPPNPEWEGIVSLNQYYLGCTFADWYRSSEHSLMRDFGDFNDISQKILNEKLDFFAGPFERPFDSNRLTGIISSPVNNAEIDITKPVIIKGTANATYFDNYKVEYFAGNNASQGGWQIIAQSPEKVINGDLAVWDASNLESGDYRIRLTATGKIIRLPLLDRFNMPLLDVFMARNKIFREISVYLYKSQDNCSQAGNECFSNGNCQAGLKCNEAEEIKKCIQKERSTSCIVEKKMKRCSEGALGNFCKDDSACQSGLKCISNRCADGGVGAPCSLANDCQQGLFCDLNFCSYKRPVPLGWVDEGSFYVESKKKWPRPYEAIWHSSRKCGKIGGAFSGDCREGTKCIMQSGSEEGACSEAKKGYGCWQDSDCQQGLKCANQTNCIGNCFGQCTGGQANEFCNSNSDCQSGLRCEIDSIKKFGICVKDCAP